MNKKIIQAQLNKLLKQEAKFLEKHNEKKPSKLDEFVVDKVPQKLQQTLQSVFSKSFALVFEKGSSVIEKSYNREEIEIKHKVNAYAFSLKQDKKRIDAFGKQASKSEAKNIAISGVKGIGLGLLGIGVPDIPVFLGMILKGIYEIALQFGFEYDTEKERYFIINVIATSLSYGDKAVLYNEILNDYIVNPNLPKDYDALKEVEKVSDVLANELLVMKFIQGLPIVGVVGGVSDAVFVKKILDFAKLKYKRRFLENQL